MPKNNYSILEVPLAVINIGLSKFSDSLEKQQIDVVQVDWVPPAGGDQEMMDLLDQLM